MKKISAMLFIGLFGFMSLANAADQCNWWVHKAYPVTMEACSYESGGSGYYKITNTGSSAAAICWIVVSNNGRRDSGCNSNVGAGESTTGSCFDCGSRNDGVRYILLESYKPLR